MVNFGGQLRNNCFQLLNGLQLLPEDFPHHEAPEKSQGCMVGAERGGAGVLSSTSDDSSSEILVQKVDVICVMDERHFLLKPPPPGRMDGQMDGQTDGRTDG